MTDRLTPRSPRSACPASSTTSPARRWRPARACGIDFPDALADLASKAFMIVIQDFQDPYTLNVNQLMKCCVEEITPDGRLIPFCAYNSVGYREQVREQLSGVAGGHGRAQRRRARRPARAHSARVPHRRRRGRGGPDRRCRSTSVGRCGDRRRRRSLDARRLVDDLPGRRRRDTEAVKSCCAAVYGVDLVAPVPRRELPPRRRELTRRLAELLDLRPGEQVLDVASGIGTTALLLAAEHDVDVVGVDLGAAQVAKAPARAAPPASATGPRSEVGDAERLPVDDDSFDAVVSECAFCTFPDKATAAAEVARVAAPRRPASASPTSGSTPTGSTPSCRPRRPHRLHRRCPPDRRRRRPPRVRRPRRHHVERHDQALPDTIERIVAGCAPCASPICRCSAGSTSVAASRSPDAPASSSSGATPATCSSPPSDLDARTTRSVGWNSSPARCRRQRDHLDLHRPRSTTASSSDRSPPPAASPNPTSAAESCDFDVEASSGGNVGAVEIRVFGPAR